MSTIVSLLLSILISITTAVSGSLPGNNPSESVKSIGNAVSETVSQDGTPNNGLDDRNVGNSQDNFGTWVSSLAPEEPKVDGAAFGNKVSTAAKENGNEVGQEEPSVEPPLVPPIEPPVEPPITPPGPPTIIDPCENWGDNNLLPPTKPMWGDLCLLY